MPKPYLTRRPSGWSVRFFVPTQLQPVLGRRFIVRALGHLNADAARLEAARLGYALGEAFRQGVRAVGEMDDYRKLISGFEIKTDSAGRVSSIKTDGSDADNRAAIAAAQVISQAAAPERKSSMSIRDAVGLFIEQFAQRDIAPATLHETRATLDLFRVVVGNRVRLSELSARDIDKFRDALSVWPARARLLPGYRDLNTLQILRKARAEKPAGISARTKDKHIDNARKFLGWAVKRGEMPTNFLSGVRIQTKTQRSTITRRAFTPEELEQLFSPAPELLSQRQKTPSFFWLPVLALYTGARLRELAQLRTSDVKTVAGVWGLDINLNAGPLKNATSQRFVPLAKPVLEAGFLEYLKETRIAGFDRVFPDGSWSAKNGPGDKTSKWFNRTYRPAAGVTESGAVFHSFRHSFASAGNAVGLTEAQIGALTGHASDSVLGRHYIHPQTLPDRQRHIETIAAAFSVTPDGYQPDQFAAVLAALKRKKRASSARSARAARAKATAKRKGA